MASVVCGAIGWPPQYQQGSWVEPLAPTVSTKPRVLPDLPCTSSALRSVRYSSMLTKLGRKKGQLSPRKPHLTTCTGVLSMSVVNTSSRLTPATTLSGSPQMDSCRIRRAWLHMSSKLSEPNANISKLWCIRHFKAAMQYRVQHYLHFIQRPQHSCTSLTKLMSSRKAYPQACISTSLVAQAELHCEAHRKV